MAYISRAGWGARPPAGSRNALAASPSGSGIHWNGPACAASIRTQRGIALPGACRLGRGLGERLGLMRGPSRRTRPPGLASTSSPPT